MDKHPADSHPERLFTPLSGQSKLAFGLLLKAIDEARPLAQKRRKSLPYDIRDLWAALTTDRAERKSAYLSAPESLSAYLRYFMPWNVYRYLRLLPALDLGILKSGSAIVDLGSGPLSLPIALFIAKPELRALSLSVYAVDRAPQGMEAGTDILSSLSLLLDGKLPEWNVIRVHGSAESAIKEKADLVCAGYFLNEFGRRDSPGLEERAARAARIIEERLKPHGRVLVLEPGDARSASLISALRGKLIGSGFRPIAPCPHAEPCPMPGFSRSERSTVTAGNGGRELVRDSTGRPLVLASGKRPWCHFTFDSSDAPPELLSLSAKAGLPKEGASLSFLFAGNDQGEGQAAGPEPVRIVSEPFPLPGALLGRYACCRTGYALLRASSASLEWRKAVPGDVVRIDTATSPGRDPKTHAIILDAEPVRPDQAALRASGEPERGSGRRQNGAKPAHPPVPPESRKKQGKKTPRKGSLPPLRPGGSGRT